jgi:hypothetical protein
MEINIEKYKIQPNGRKENAHKQQNTKTSYYSYTNYVHTWKKLGKALLLIQND